MKLAHVGINLVSCAVALLTFSLQAETGQPLLLVVNKSEATLAIVDTTSGRLLAKVPTGDFPHEVAASNNGRMAFVTNYGDARPGNTLSVIDVAARKELRRVDLGTLRRPHGVTVVDGKAVLTAEDARQVARYDPSTNRIDWRFDTGQDVTHMVLASRSGRMLFTSNIGSNTIGIIEQQAKDWKQTLVRVGPGPEGLDLSPDGRELWAAHTGNGGVSIVDVSARNVIQTIDAGTRRANRLKFTPDGRLVLISDMDGGGLVVIDTQSRRVVNRLPVGRMPEGILVTPDGTRAYVAVTGDNRVSVVDLATLRITPSIETGNGPDGMAWVSLQ